MSEPAKAVLGSTVKLPIAQEDYFLPRLKAGVYYKAQKIYVDWIYGLEKLFSSNKLDINAVRKEDGTVDNEKVEKMLTETKTKAKIDLESVISQLEISASKKIELLSICLGMTVEEVGEKFYQEDLEVLLQEAIQVNNFLENLKKSVAPTVVKGPVEEKTVQPVTT